jgi:hypothetical protein
VAPVLFWRFAHAEECAGARVSNHELYFILREAAKTPLLKDEVIVGAR